MWDENKYPLGDISIFKNAISESEDVLFITLLKGAIHNAFRTHEISIEEWVDIRDSIIAECQKDFLCVLEFRQNAPKYPHGIRRD